MSDALLEPRLWSCLNVARDWCRMSGEEAKLKLKIEQAEAAVARVQKVYDEAKPVSSKDSCLQLLLLCWQKKRLCWRTKRLGSK